MKNNPIPSGYPSWNSFMALNLKSQEDCKSILKELEEKLKNGGDITAEEKKVALFYKAAMDEEAIEKVGVKPMKPLLDLCEETANSKDDKVVFATSLGKMALTYGISPFFSIGAGPDKKNSEHSIAQVAQGGIKLPDRDYYFDEDKEEKRVAYKKTMALLLTLLEDSSATEPLDDAIATAEKVYELEKSLAEAHMTKTENRDPHETYNKMTMEELNQVGDDKFDFSAYFQSVTGGMSVEEIGDLCLRNVKALKRAAEVASNTDSSTLCAYFRWLSVASCAPYLSSPFVNAHFDFYEKTLSGTSEIKPLESTYYQISTRSSTFLYIGSVSDTENAS